MYIYIPGLFSTQLDNLKIDTIRFNLSYNLLIWVYYELLLMTHQSEYNT